MNVNVEALRDSLDLRVQKGRTPIEAAGEERWMARLERDLGVLSNQTVSEREQLIDEWLAQQLGISVEKVGPAVVEADLYADFLMSQLDIEDPTVTLKLDSTLAAWRRQHQG